MFYVLPPPRKPYGTIEEVTGMVFLIAIIILPFAIIWELLKNVK